MDKKMLKRSKFLSFVLRHNPDAIGLTLDQHGWADVEELIQRANTHNELGDAQITLEHISQIVSEDEKQRYSLEMSGPYTGRIRANQGHSIQVDLELKEKTPPTTLYHGTAKKNLDSILESGLIKGSRNHVHLSVDAETAKKVGSRHGSPAILIVRAEDMGLDGHKFYCSENGVWLVEHVPVKYLHFPK